MKTPILVSGIVALALVGAGVGYLAGPLVDQHANAAGFAAPLPAGTASTPPPSSTPSRTPSIPLIRKTPQPNPVPALVAGELEFKTRNLTVSSPVAGQVRLSIRVPTGWQLTPAKDKPSEVRFIDETSQRTVRIESALTPDKTVKQALQDILTNLQSSQPYQNFVQPLFQNEGQVTDDDGRARQVATLVYTYIPNASTRYVIVRFVATGDTALATISMSVSGLPKEQKALEKILAEATASVRIRD